MTRPGQKTLVDIYGHKTTGALVLMVGKKDAKSLVSSALGHARVTSPDTWLDRAVATVAYLCEHEGEATIGGAPAVAVCHRGARLYWPFLVLNGRKYLRGFDVTPTGICPRGRDCVHINYDQDWHAKTDQERILLPVGSDPGFQPISRYVEDWITPSEIFTWRVDPEIFREEPTVTPDFRVVRIVRHYELED